jgi:hypothetical protein
MGVAKTEKTNISSLEKIRCKCFCSGNKNYIQDVSRMQDQTAKLISSHVGNKNGL